MYSSDKSILLSVKLNVKYLLKVFYSKRFMFIFWLFENFLKFQLPLLETTLVWWDGCHSYHDFLIWELRMDDITVNWSKLISEWDEFIKKLWISPHEFLWLLKVLTKMYFSVKLSNKPDFSSKNSIWQPFLLWAENKHVGDKIWLFLL